MEMATVDDRMTGVVETVTGPRGPDGLGGAAGNGIGIETESVMLTETETETEIVSGIARGIAALIEKGTRSRAITASDDQRRLAPSPR